MPYADAIGAPQSRAQLPLFQIQTMRFSNRIVRGKIKKHNNNNNNNKILLFGSTRRQQPRLLCAKSPAPPSFGDGLILAVQTEQLLPLKLAFFPQVISCIGDSSDCHSAFLEKRPACKTRSSNCYCFKPFVEHYYQFVFVKSVRCLYY